MARRPDVFNQDAFQAAIRDQGCPESFISPVTSDFRLFVPLILANLGQDRLFDIVEGARAELSLGAQEPAWRLACKHIAAWAEAEIAEYKSHK